MATKKQVNQMLDLFFVLSEHEREIIEMAINWDDSQKEAFEFARIIYEENLNKIQNSGEKIILRNNNKRKLG